MKFETQSNSAYSFVWDFVIQTYLSLIVAQWSTGHHAAYDCNNSLDYSNKDSHTIHGIETINLKQRNINSLIAFQLKTFGQVYFAEPSPQVMCHFWIKFTVSFYPVKKNLNLLYHIICLSSDLRN